MKRLFQKWLLVFVSIAFIISSLFVWFAYSYDAKKDALDVMRNNLTYISKLLERQDHNNQTIDGLKKRSLEYAHNLATDLTKVSSQNEREQLLEERREEWDAATICTIDGSGYIVESTSPDLVGGNLRDFKNSAVFFEGMKDANFEKIVSLTPENGSESFRYVIVSRRDASGLLVVVYDSKYIDAIREFADVGDIERSFCVGFNAELRIAPNTIHWESGERVFVDKYHNESHLCLSQPFGDRILTGAIPLSEVYFARGHIFIYMLVGYMLISVATFLVVSVLLQKIVIDSIRGLDDSLNKITDGALDVRVDVHSAPEFATLSECVNQTVDSLKKSIEREKTRIKAELNLCNAIQSSLLPTDSDFSFVEDYDLCASMKSAKEVSGDFYDYFAVDDEHFAFLIADVSDKGISAAMYMASSKVLLKNLLQSGLSPEKAFEEANRQLCRNNKASMFLTALAFVVDIKTGKAIGVNAGHCPPAIKRAGKEWTLENYGRSYLLGILETAKYEPIDFEFKEGDRIFLYTDGVTEAMDHKGRLFGDDRLLDALGQSSGEVKETIGSLSDVIEKYADGTAQSDDITMLCLERRAK